MDVILAGHVRVVEQLMRKQLISTQINRRVWCNKIQIWAQTWTQLTIIANSSVKLLCCQIFKKMFVSWKSKDTICHIVKSNLDFFQKLTNILRSSSVQSLLKLFVFFSIQWPLLQLFCQLFSPSVKVSVAFLSKSQSPWFLDKAQIFVFEKIF